MKDSVSMFSSSMSVVSSSEESTARTGDRVTLLGGEAALACGVGEAGLSNVGGDVGLASVGGDTGLSSVGGEGGLTRVGAAPCRGWNHSLLRTRDGHSGHARTASRTMEWRTAALTVSAESPSPSRAAASTILYNSAAGRAFASSAVRLPRRVAAADITQGCQSDTKLLALAVSRHSKRGRTRSLSLSHSFC